MRAVFVCIEIGDSVAYCSSILLDKAVCILDAFGQIRLRLFDPAFVDGECYGGGDWVRRIHNYSLEELCACVIDE